MEENPSHYKDLIRRYRDNKATAEELAVFFQLLKEGKLSEELEAVMNEDLAAADETTEEPTYRIPLYKRAWVRVAAAILVLLSVAGGYLLRNKSPEPAIAITEKKQPIINDLAPGGNKAILELADGSAIVLDSASNGALTKQGAAAVTKKDGHLAYNLDGKEPAAVLFNTIKTPRGGQYQLELTDGTKVWLNAASSLRFPTAFAGAERKVELTGEAYFEVAKNASMPFVVAVADKANVQVLGTHFNINAYDDEATINTTLLEGKVKVSGSGDAKTIEPGQQARLNANGQIAINRNPDIEQVMAWKNGLFHFEGENIDVIMRQLARWYDFDVTYDKQVTEKFFVKINRNTNISNIFKILETTGGAHFKIDGKKITVMP